jgi:hypothetical protein
MVIKMFKKLAICLFTLFTISNVYATNKTDKIYYDFELDFITRDIKQSIQGTLEDCCSDAEHSFFERKKRTRFPELMHHPIEELETHRSPVFRDDMRQAFSIVEEYTKEGIYDDYFMQHSSKDKDTTQNIWWQNFYSLRKEFLGE